MTAIREARRYLNKEALGYGPTLVEQPINQMPYQSGSAPLRAWRSRRFLVVLWLDANGFERLTCQRAAMTKDGQWEDGITWDELMRLKREAGFGDRWAVEVYPEDAHVINVANMRHLWLVDGAPIFAWKARE
jgi:hypothetical protein